MAKFKTDERVFIPSENKYGVIRIHDVYHDRENLHTESNYYVLLEGENREYRWYKREDLKKVPKKQVEKTPYYVKFYQASQGRSVTLVAKVSYNNDWNGPFYGLNCLTIGASFYNGVDEPDANLAVKIAKNRIKTRPFCKMASDFGGEFNEKTVNAIMDAKGEYLVENIAKFVSLEKALSGDDYEPLIELV